MTHHFLSRVLAKLVDRALRRSMFVKRGSAAILAIARRSARSTAILAIARRARSTVRGL